MDYLKISIDIISPLLVFSGLIFAGLQLKATRKVHSEQLEWNRRQNFLNFSFSADPEMIHVLERMDKHLNINNRDIKNEIKIVEINGIKDIYSSVYNDIHFVLSRLEVMCIAIHNGQASLDICKQMLETRVVTFYKLFLPYINKSRNLRNSTKLFEFLETYAIEWGKKKALPDSVSELGNKK